MGWISKKGATALCIFEGTNNNPKHVSCMAQEFYSSAGINWWKTPPESPDMNPIENLWHEIRVSIS